MSSSITTSVEYICPGELHSISRAVHFSRLAAFYPKCKECPLRCETGNLPKRITEHYKKFEQHQKNEQHLTRRTLFTTEGVRGVYINKLDRTKAAQITSALASLLWEETPFVGRSENDPPHTARRVRQTVVVGYDERPSSPDLFAGVTAALIRMGCEVIDIGMTSKPCFWFAVQHLEARAGVYISGSGCDAAWTGLDFVGENARPLSLGTTSMNSRSLLSGALCATLNRLEKRLSQPIGRPIRFAGHQRTFQATVPYLAGLWKHFHELRPLSIVVGCTMPQVVKTLSTLFEQLPCRLQLLTLPRRKKEINNDEDVDLLQVGQTVKEFNADMGMLIDDDGQRCRFIDEQGIAIDACDITRLLADLQLSFHPDGSVVLEQNVSHLKESLPLLPDSTCTTVLPRLGIVYETMQTTNAIFAGGNSGYYWFRKTLPTCDAILTLANILTLLSRTDASFSQIICGRQNHVST
ncbi:hypothetical protein MNBD_PLANCTO02-3046 [hydrothermal vent metagenome]|uniref:Alpha-D-phosphohexomutase alpha/beta/alpha domain-containing protein n=1 Tax=hydrothermal vent metagenome TaxID=652676 RepID=A0A3B1DV49_9ZZZZ